MVGAQGPVSEAPPAPWGALAFCSPRPAAGIRGEQAEPERLLQTPGPSWFSTAAQRRGQSLSLAGGVAFQARLEKCRQGPGLKPGSRASWRRSRRLNHFIISSPVKKRRGRASWPGCWED